MHTRIRIALAVLILSGTGALVASRLGSDPRNTETAAASEAGDVLSCERDGFRYEFHLPTGREALYRLDAGTPGGSLDNVIAQHAPTAAACRDRLQQELGVRDLEDLRVRYADAIRRLHALGYL